MHRRCHQPRSVCSCALCSISCRASVIFMDVSHSRRTQPCSTRHGSPLEGARCQGQIIQTPLLKILLWLQANSAVVLSCETFLIYSQFYLIHFKAQWVDKDILEKPVFTAGIFSWLDASAGLTMTEQMWSLLSVRFHMQTKEIISSSPECGMMLHRLSSHDQRQEKQANWHSLETVELEERSTLSQNSNNILFEIMQC